MDGGVYLVISFHELDLILPLLRDLPGAQWTVTHTTMERQVECIVANASSRFVASPVDTSSSDAEPTEEKKPRKPLNVLIARRYALKEDNVAPPHRTMCWFHTGQCAFPKKTMSRTIGLNINPCTSEHARTFDLTYVATPSSRT